MNKNRTKNAILNILFALMLQFVVFFRGLILPRIIIPTYGSDINGLISSITQFLAYISLLEAGVGSIFRTSLYKPLALGDMNGVSGIINEQKRFYRKIGIVFGGYVLALCAFYPLIAKTEIPALYTVSLILILSVSTFTEYFISLPYASLLSADQKIRISHIVSIIYILANMMVSVILASFEVDIRLIYLSACLIGLFRPLFYTLYVKKHYKLNKNASADKTALSQRWSGMMHHFAYYVHKNTDGAILTVFMGTAIVSVYNVYGSIIFGISQIAISISTGAAAGLGNLIALNNKEQLNKAVNQFELIQAGLTTVLFSITALMLMPFVRIYTIDMTDVNYIQPLFGYVLIVAEATYCFRCIYSTVSTNANKYKETKLGAIIECVTNLGVSLILVVGFKKGIVGVAIGTAIGSLSRYIFEVIFLSKNVINRHPLKALKMFLISLTVSVLSIVVCDFLFNYNSINSLSLWVVYAIVTSIIVAIIAIVIYWIFYREIIKSFVIRLKGKYKNGNNLS